MSKNRRKRHIKNNVKEHRNEKGREDNDRDEGKKGLRGDRIPGVISTTRSGFGFFAPDKKEKGQGDIFIPAKYMRDVLSGDRVEIVLKQDRYKDRSDDRGPVGKIVKILERDRKTVVGELLSGKQIRPLDKKISSNINVNGSLQGAKRGDWVKLDLKENADMNSGRTRFQRDEIIHSGSVSDVIGQVGTIQGDLAAIIAEYDLQPPYNEAQNAEAAILESVDINREDMCDMFTLTIDPVDAKDFDDAISVQETDNPDELLLGVHIADVAAWIRPESKWDLWAKDRCFTSYLPGKTLPMLPKPLTKLISLTAGEPVPAHTVLMRVDINTGEIVKVVRRCHSKILVNKRLNYDEVQEHIDGKTPKDWDAEFAKKVGQFVELTRRMREYRKKKEQFLVLATVDIHVMYDDEKNEIIGMAKKVQREADQAVEECMLAANSKVAEEILSSQIPGVFRIHDEPDAAKLQEFATFMNETFGKNPGDLTTRKSCNHFLENLPDDQNRGIILSNFLRSLPRATYKEEVDDHYGLGKEKYLHFTSPIRRYSDLTVHQQLWAKEFDEPVRKKSQMESVSSLISKKEKNNDEAYFAANDRMKLHYLQKQLDEHKMDEMEVVVSKITGQGLMIDITDIGLYGLIPTEILEGDFVKTGNKLVNKRTRFEYKCGDMMKVMLDRIDFIKGLALFSPVKRKK